MNAPRLASRRVVAAIAPALALLALATPGPVHAVCVQPPGDLNASGTTNVADVVCAMLTTAWYTSLAGTGDPASPPSCLAGPFMNADANCDGVVTVQDALIFVRNALGLALDPALDAVGDGCVDVCATVNLAGPPAVVPAYVHGVSSGGGRRLQALGTGASVIGPSTGFVGGAGGEGVVLDPGLLPR